MKHKLIPKYFLPCAIAVSLLAFIYVNVDANGAAVCKAAGKALTEQSAIAKEAEAAQTEGIKTPNLTFVAAALALAQRFIPVSN